MKRLIFPLFAIAVISCSLPGQEPKINVAPYLNQNEKAVLNDVIFEVQKVLDTIDELRKQKALKYVTKLDYPNWVITRKTEKVLFLTNHKFIASKEFSVPSTCIKSVGGAELNACHIKLETTLKKLAEAYDCDVKVYPLNLEGLKEKVEIICSY